MAWIRVDDGMMEHPKILALSDREFRAHMAALCYTGRRRDPHIPVTSLHLFGATVKVAKRLTDVGVWDVNGDGWVIHDWHEFNGAKTPAERSRAFRERHRDET